MNLNIRTVGIIGVVVGAALTGCVAAAIPAPGDTPAPTTSSVQTLNDDSVQSLNGSEDATPAPQESEPAPQADAPAPQPPATTPTPSASPAAEPIGSGLDDEHPWRGGPNTTEPQVPKNPAPAPSPAVNAPLNCAPWTEPGWLGADGQPTSCIWAMPTAGGTIVLKACEQEDSENCFWDATTRGNGQGRSFINIRGHIFYEGK